MSNDFKMFNKKYLCVKRLPMNKLFAKVESEIFNNSFYIQLDDEEVLNIVQDLLYPHIKLINGDVDVKKDELFEIKKTTCYEITFNEKKIKIEKADIYSSLQCILFNHISLREDIILLHGAIVKRNDKLYALLGASGAGKSTLAAYLCSNGYEFICDDKFCINVSSLKVTPFSRNLMLRENSVLLLRKKNNIKTEPILWGDYKRDSVISFKNGKAEGEIIALFISRDDINWSNYIYEDSYLIEAKKMMSNLYITNNKMADKIQKCIMISKKIRGYNIVYSSLDVAKNMIDDIT